VTAAFEKQGFIPESESSQGLGRPLELAGASLTFTLELAVAAWSDSGRTAAVSRSASISREQFATLSNLA
jgi:hypothetical protein